MPDPANPTILDHIDDIRAPKGVFDPPGNEYWQIVRLWMGMEFLYRQAKHADDDAGAALNPDGGAKVVLFNHIPTSAPPALLECGFDWYAISACQFVRLIGEIGHRADPMKHPLNGSEYLVKIIPEVKAYRDKVAAHFAWVTENKRDNAAERSISVFPKLQFENDSIVVQGFVLTQRMGGKVTSSESLKPWSLRKTHEELRKRYQPEIEAKAPADSVAATVGQVAPEVPECATDPPAARSSAAGESPHPIAESEMEWIEIAIVPRPGLAPDGCIYLARSIQQAIDAVGGEEYSPRLPGRKSNLEELLEGELPMPHSLQVARDSRGHTHPALSMTDLMEHVREFHKEHGDGAELIDSSYVSICVGTEDPSATVKKVAEMLPRDTVTKIRVFKSVGPKQK